MAPRPIITPYPTTRNESKMEYRANITVTVKGAEAPDLDYLHNKAAEVAEYLGFEGEDVEVAVNVTDDGDEVN